MNQLYQLAGLSRQAHQQWRFDQLEGQQQRVEQHAIVIAHVHKQRMEHPTMGLRKIYDSFTQPHNGSIGRDSFISIAINAGLGVRRAVNRQRTTYRVDSRYPNLLVGKTLTDVNQVWVSDITYYRLARGFSYITLLMDLYSRRILGSCAATSLHAHWSVGVLEYALAGRQITVETGLIHHSDQGSQYLSNDYLSVLAHHEVAVSTCQIVYENAHAERINGIIKQEYLNAWRVETHQQLLECLARAVDRYNSTRPHTALGGISPIAFEERLRLMPHKQHPVMIIWPQQPLVNLTHGVDVPYIVN